VYGVAAVNSTGTRRKMALKVEALPPGTISSNDIYWEVGGGNLSSLCFIFRVARKVLSFYRNGC
jgi:hypothetical protein